MEDWVPWSVAVVSALATAVVVARDIATTAHLRQQLRKADLEREKLALEVKRLRTTPELQGKRRALYDRLRAALQIIHTHADMPDAVMAELHGAKHDANFLFPDDIVEYLDQWVQHGATLLISSQMLRAGSPERERHASEKHEALLFFVRQQAGELLEKFKPFLAEG